MEALLQQCSVPRRGHAVIFVFQMKFPEDLCPGMFCGSQNLRFLLFLSGCKQCLYLPK